jgi:hypothetical protein
MQKKRAQRRPLELPANFEAHVVQEEAQADVAPVACGIQALLDAVDSLTPPIVTETAMPLAAPESPMPPTEAMQDEPAPMEMEHMHAQEGGADVMEHVMGEGEGELSDVRAFCFLWSGLGVLHAICRF